MTRPVASVLQSFTRTISPAIFRRSKTAKRRDTKGETFASSLKQGAMTDSSTLSGAVRSLPFAVRA